MKFMIKKNLATNTIFRMRGRWQWTDAMTADYVGWPERPEWTDAMTGDIIGW